VTFTLAWQVLVARADLPDSVYASEPESGGEVVTVVEEEEVSGWVDEVEMRQDRVRVEL
jgi:hypothetical protein